MATNHKQKNQFQSLCIQHTHTHTHTLPDGGGCGGDGGCGIDECPLDVFNTPRPPMLYQHPTRAL